MVDFFGRSLDELLKGERVRHIFLLYHLIIDASLEKEVFVGVMIIVSPQGVRKPNPC
jgi:hypothetical protein